MFEPRLVLALAVRAEQLQRRHHGPNWMPPADRIVRLLEVLHKRVVRTRLHRLNGLVVEHADALVDWRLRRRV